MSSDRWGDPDAAIARVEAQVAQAQENARRAERLQAEIGSLSAIARSARGEVTATVGAAGRLVSLDLGDDAMELEPRALAHLITATVHEAHGRAAARAVEATAEAFGEDSPVTARLRDEAAALTAGPDDGIRYESWPRLI